MHNYGRSPHKLHQSDSPLGSDPLRGFDPFLVQKQKALVDSKGAVDCLSKRVMTACNSVSNFTQQLLKQYVIQLLEVRALSLDRKWKTRKKMFIERVELLLFLGIVYIWEFFF